MTRLSDSLRGLADRAPIDGAVVSAASASRRIHRNRRLRVAANATVGVGAAAVVALAALNPGFGGAADPAADLAAAPAAADTAKDAYAGEGMTAEGSMLAWGWCGSRPFDTDVPSASDLFTLTLDGVPAEVEQGATVDVGVTVGLPDAPETAFTSTATSFLVLWDGVVVGLGQAPAEIATQELSDGIATWDSQVAMVNCWDGAALPAGDYQLVAYQDFYEQPADAAATDPTEPPAAEPSSAPTGIADPPVVEPSLAPVEPTPSTEVSVGPMTEDAAARLAADEPLLRAVSEPVAFTVTGDRVEDPFGQYLAPPIEALPYPDDYLDPATARAEFAARATTIPWDMAEGTQRVVKASDSLTDSDPNAWLAGYFGCPVDSSTGPTFPATSAEWPLVEVKASLPNALDVKYGWIVDDNPEVDFSVTNVSNYTLPGFWGQPNTSLYLVKDGRVVAQAYLPSIDSNSYDSSTYQDGMLAPGVSLGGMFVWRDVNGCWVDNSTTAVSAGTYIVLASQDIYLDNGGSVMYVDPLIEDLASSSIDDGAKGTADTPAASIVDIAPAPVDGTYDAVGFQVWTSLGRITVN